MEEGEGGRREDPDQWAGMGELERIKWATEKLVRKGAKDRMSLAWRQG